MIDAMKDIIFCVGFFTTAILTAFAILFVCDMLGLTKDKQ